MTPAVRAAERAGISFRLHRYEHDPRAPSYGLEAAVALDLDPAQVFKTLVAALPDGSLVVALVPVSCELDLKALAAAVGAKRAAMASPEQAERATGFVTGGISPLGQRKRLETVLDSSAEAFSTLYVSAGRRGLEIELTPVELIQLTKGRWADVARRSH